MMPIYVKTVYSFLSSLITVDDLVSFGKQYNLKSLCICDDNMYGVMDFIKKSNDVGIKPIIGLDVGKVLLYAKNYIGYQNLLKLVTIKSEREITIDDFKKYNCDLICVIKYENIEELEQFNEIYDDVYIGFNNNEELISIKKNSLKPLYVKKVLCLKESDIEILKYLEMLRDNKTLSDDYSFDSNILVNDLSVEYSINLDEFINKCNLVLPRYHLNLPNYMSYNDTSCLSSDEYLYNLSVAGITKRLEGKVTVRYRDRLLHELDVIKKMGFSNYFLIVYDYIRYAKKNNILVGPGRGSAAGSLVSYSLGITDVDPIKYDLLFERFLNSERVTMPDIDTDFPDIERDDVISYVKDKYGLKKVAGIITFGTFGSKMALRDIGRVLNVSLYTIDELCKLVKNNMSLLDNYNTNIKFKMIVEGDNKLKKLLEVASRIEGLPRHTSIHAAGIIISGSDLDEIVPLTYNDGMYLSGYEASFLEELGLLKMDFLGLKNLTTIKNTLSLINNNLDMSLNFNNLPLFDEKTNELFQKGDMLGIFQFESAGMRDFLIKLHPVSFTDIYNANAIYRPGPSDNIPLFLARRNGRVSIDYLDESLKDILKDTYGIMIYQEQIMLIAVKMASFTLGEADILRRAMSKKKLDILEGAKEKFINNSINNGYSRELSEKVYELILSFASYGFNKSHSVAYSMIAYKMAYLKANYPMYFYLALLNSVTMDDSKTIAYIKEMKKRDLKIFKPDINRSFDDYRLYYDGIVLPFTMIKGISSMVSKKIIDCRGEKFLDIYDFFSKMMIGGISRNVITSLIDSGAMDSFGYTRASIYENLDSLINYGNLTKDLDPSFVLRPEIVLLPEFSKEILIANEKNSFGFYLTNHPVNLYKSKYDNIVDLVNLPNYFNKVVTCIVMIDKVKTVNTKKNETMAFVLGSDEETTFDFVLFPKVYSTCFELKKGDIIKMIGKIERRSSYQMIVSSIERVED